MEMSKCRRKGLLEFPFKKLSNLDDYMDMLYRLRLLWVTKSWFSKDPNTRNSLINLYSKCPFFGYARKLVVEGPESDSVSWSALISGYAQNGLAAEAISALYEMHLLAVKCNEFTFLSVLKACKVKKDLSLGMQIHGSTVVTGFELDEYVSECFACYDMVSSGIRPNEFRLSGIIKSCTRLMDGDRGTQIHGYIIKLRYDTDLFSANALIDIVSWNANCWLWSRVRIMYQVLLKLVLEWVSRELGRQLHSCLIKMDAKSDSFVCVGLIDMYSNRHLRDDVRMVFKLMPENDLITWNAVISGHSFNGEDMDSLRRAGYYQVLIACLPALQILFICC
ncbi:pentatricopeptide repeat-containing protein At3g24000, mitochondrial-like [Tripterygium wilfordii]|uniref:pentatricopeptide repeat-containing protein At3g24000, mitochondrial-like n=1 Tax=Tripterygium wilfordii TaxID=458696 RepID=UPI0018F8349B|nr:pentatricopeptide repeat-containing protein At3g24000, mitochondrial-like [Tripterygium wilfordii]